MKIIIETLLLWAFETFCFYLVFNRKRSNVNCDASKPKDFVTQKVNVA